LPKNSFIDDDLLDLPNVALGADESCGSIFLPIELYMVSDFMLIISAYEKDLLVIV